MRYYARDVEVPEHLLSPWAHRQATAIAHELSATSAEYTEGSLDPFDSLVGFTVAIGDALIARREVYSFAFIAVLLLRRTRHQEDLTWFYDYELRIDPKQRDAAYELITQILNVLPGWGYDVDQDRLISSFGIQTMSRILNRFGRKVIVQAVDRVTSSNLGQDTRVRCWSWFNPYIETIVAENANSPEERARRAEAEAKARKTAERNARIQAGKETAAIGHARLGEVVKADLAFKLSDRLRRDTGLLGDFLAEQSAKWKCDAADVISVLVARLLGFVAGGGGNLGSIKSWRQFEPAVAETLGKHSKERKSDAA